MGWLLNKLDHLPEPLRLVVVNAVLWGVHRKTSLPFDSAPLHEEPIAPKVQQFRCLLVRPRLMHLHRWPCSSRFHSRPPLCSSLPCAR